MEKVILEYGLEYPKTNEQEVLLTLIIQGHVSIFDFPYLSGFRTRVSNIKKNRGLELERIFDKRCNKFGNEYVYIIHKLLDSNKKKAIEIYKKISNQI